MKGIVQILLSTVSLALPVGLVMVLAGVGPWEDDSPKGSKLEGFASKFNTLTAAPVPDGLLELPPGFDDSAAIDSIGALGDALDEAGHADLAAQLSPMVSRPREQARRPTEQRHPMSRLGDAVRLFGRMPSLQAMPGQSAGASGREGDAASMEEVLVLLRGLDDQGPEIEGLEKILGDPEDMEESMRDLLELLDTIETQLDESAPTRGVKATSEPAGSGSLGSWMSSWKSEWDARQSAGVPASKGASRTRDSR